MRGKGLPGQRVLIHTQYVVVLDHRAAVDQLTWMECQSVHPRKRATSTELVIGALADNGLITWPRKDSTGERLAGLRNQGITSTEVIGVKVVNRGRAPTRVERWTVTWIGDSISFTPLAGQVGPELHTTLPPAPTPRGSSTLGKSKQP
jgi:hypothetical protein